MAKPKNNRRQHFSRKQAIALHAEANKSDPFAAKRMAMTLAKHPGEINEVAKESKRILDARDAAVRKAFAEWKASEERRRIVAQVQAPCLSMSMFLNRADYDAAVAA